MGKRLMALSAALLLMTGAAEAQSYRWQTAAAPPADAVIGPGGWARPACVFHQGGRELLGDFHGGSCHSNFGGQHMSGT